MKLNRTIMAILVLTSTAASAVDRHYICYQDSNTAFRQMTGLFACRAEPGGRCEIGQPISGMTGGSLVTAQAGVPMSTSSRKYSFPNVGLYTAEIKFFGPTNFGTIPDETLRCSVEPTDLWSSPTQSSGMERGTPTPGATLLGYSTDESGLISTGIWKKTSRKIATISGKPTSVRQTVEVPRDFVIVGGGVVGSDSHPGALIYKSTYTEDLNQRGWSVGTQDHLIPMSHSNDAYAIGLKIEGIGIYDLRNLFATLEAGSPATVAWPSAFAQLPSTANYELLGGGFTAFSNPVNGQFATASSPTYTQICTSFCRNRPNGWWVSSKDHVISSPGSILAVAKLIKDYIQIGNHTYHVDSNVSTHTSAVAQHPSVVVTGKPGEYALTGIGAFVDWWTYGSAGNLLWELKPRPEIAGVEVGSKDHAVYSPATIQGFAIGVKLRMVGS